MLVEHLMRKRLAPTRALTTKSAPRRRRIISAAERPASIGLSVRSDTMSWQNHVVRETKGSRRLDDLALFVGGRVGRHVLSVSLFIDGTLRR